jgi:hypothetical protein
MTYLAPIEIHANFTFNTGWLCEGPAELISAGTERTSVRFQKYKSERFDKFSNHNCTDKLPAGRN